MNFLVHTDHMNVKVKVVWTHEYDSGNRMNFMNLGLRRQWTHEHELRNHELCEHEIACPKCRFSALCNGDFLF